MPPQQAKVPVPVLHWSRGVCLTLLLLTGACHRPSGTVLGQAPRGQPCTILAVRAGDTAPSVVLAGVMVEKCPVAGCWFRLRDQTGVIKVDTRNAGFVVVKIPLEAKVTVAGNVASDGSEVILAATGLRY